MKMSLICIKWTCRENTFSYEGFYVKTHLKTETNDNSEMDLFYYKKEEKLKLFTRLNYLKLLNNKKIMFLT